MISLVYILFIISLIGFVLNKSLLAFIINLKIFFMAFLLILTELYEQDFILILYIIFSLIFVSFIQFFINGRESYEDIDQL